MEVVIQTRINNHSPLSSPQVLTCPEHDQEKLQFYCRSCQRLLCSLCKLRRVHAGHKILPVTHAYQALKVRTFPYYQGN